MPLHLTVYSKPSGCQACRMTKKKIEALGIHAESFTVVDVTADTPAAADALLLAEKLQIKEAPICVVGTHPSSVPLVDRQDITVWSGYRPDLLEHVAPQLSAEGEEAVAA